MGHTYRSHFFHMIWSTKERRNLILPQFEKPLYEYMGGIIRNCEGSLLRIGGTANHVHLSVKLGTLDNYSDILRALKADSSKWVSRNYESARGFAWQRGYGSFTVTYSQLEAVHRYIDNQEEHHKTRTFEEEFLEILKINNISYDPRYVFD